MSYLFSALYMAMFVLAIKSAERLPALRSGRGLAVPAAALWLLVAVPSVLQFAFPVLYRVLHRDSGLVMDHGEWWRPYTSFLVQDGGVAGTVFNLVTLAITAVLAIRVWGPVATAGIGFGTLVLYSVPVFLRPMEPGGGNSGLTFTLAASVAGLALVVLRTRASALIAAAIVADGVLTLALGDPHGVTMIAGPVIGVLVALALRRRPAEALPAEVR